VLDAPTPELRQQWRLLLKDAKIKIAPKVKTAPNAGPESKSAFSHRVDVYEANVKNQEFKMSAKEKKQWKEKKRNCGPLITICAYGARALGSRSPTNRR
jgi:hypothetical protein